MKALVCSNCGSRKLSRSGGAFVCEYCGGRFYPSAHGAVQSNTTIRNINVDELFLQAREAFAANDIADASKYYNILYKAGVKGWEVMFYKTFLFALLNKHETGRIDPIANEVLNSIQPILQLIHENIDSKEEQTIVVKDVCSKLFWLSKELRQRSIDFYQQLKKSRRKQYTQSYANNVYSSLRIMYTLGNCLVAEFGDMFASTAVKAWKNGIGMNAALMHVLTDVNANKTVVKGYEYKIKQYEPKYKAPKIKRPFVWTFSTLCIGCLGLFCISFFLILLLAIILR